MNEAVLQEGKDDRTEPVESVEWIIENAKIMIVDDDPTTVDFLHFQLSEIGYKNFVECMNSHDALRLVEEENPDVILLDLVMPGPDGLEVLRGIRSSYSSAHLPVIILTAVEHIQAKIEAFELGATDFLNKPINFFELVSRIRNALMVKTYHDKLKKQAEELKHQVALKTASLKESHTSLEKANHILRRSCEAAESSARAKNDFLANVSHELRTPLTAVIGFTEELLSGKDLPQRFEELLPVILRNGQHLLQIVNDVLDVATIEKGQLSIDRVACSPKEIIDDVVRLQKPVADAKGIELFAEIPPSMPETIYSDPVRLRQVLTNLVSNAVKFTEEGSVRIVPKLLAGGGSNPLLQFEIIDTGIGIEQSEIDEIFKPFIQSHSSDGGKYEGVGLGLTICEYLVKELGGQIHAESRPGTGSTFRLTVATGLLQDEQDSIRASNIEQNIPSGDTSEPVETVQDRPAVDCLCSRRVLLAEDSPDNQRLLRFILAKAGAEVVIADNGQVALDEIHKAEDRGEPFDIIVTDIQMPVLNGYELTKCLRQEGYRGSIVALTANAMAGEQEKCLAIGCDDYMSKPIDRASLLAMVARNSAAAFESRQAAKRN